jgi:dTDP-N-acetylfucosamine:lipid II N-acetylfucosaminyltransferase
MKIIHFACDEKFIPFVQKTFEDAFPGLNEYRLLGDPHQPLKFVIPGENVKIKRHKYWVGNEVTVDLMGFECLVVHYMNPYFMEGIRRTHPDMLVVWLGWGGDYYYLIEPYLGPLLLDKTQQLVGDRNKLYSKFQKKILDRITKLLGLLANDPLTAIIRIKEFFSKKKITISIHDVIGKVDLLWVNPEEVPMIEKALPGFNGQYHRICYYSAEDTFTQGPERMDGPDILIGNSATDTNNHLELFDCLMRVELDDRRLIVPLSYGDDWYGDEIARIGRKLFGDRFVPLRTFMPMHEYHDRIATCGTVIMNHVRQQAGTTIATALYKGAKVFLRNENPVLDFYRNMGIKLFTIQDDFLAEGNTFGPLSTEEMIQHRNILGSYWSYDTAVAGALKLESYLEEKRSGHA